MAGINVISDTTGLQIVEANISQAEQLKQLVDNQAKALTIYERIAKAQEGISSSQGIKTAVLLDNYALTTLRGNTSKDIYDSVKIFWFKVNGAEQATPEELTKLVDKWYQLTRQLVKDWDGWVRFANPDVSSISTGTRMGSLEGMTCKPSTETVAGQDDFAGNPLFAITYCNWGMVDNQPVITAIKDITPNFDFYDKEKFVGVLQMSGYVHWTELEESADHYDRGYCAVLKPYTHIEPLPEAVRPDGTIREWVLHGVCAIGMKDNGQYCGCYGVEPAWRGLSQVNINRITAQMGGELSGFCGCDWSFLKLMANIKYASLTLDGIMNGCLQYWMSDVAQIAEANTKRILIPKDSYSKFIIGSYCRIDTWDGKLDEWSARNKATTAITGAHGARITDIQKVTIDDTEYTAVYVDTEPFDTSITSGAQTKIYSWLWSTGSTANILGNDGAIELKSGKYAIKLQGIEFMWGQWVVVTDTLLKSTAESDGNYYQPYVTKNRSARSSTVTEDYEACNVKLKATGDWQYIKHEKRSHGYEFPDIVGGSSSTYQRDGIYTSPNVGTFEPLAFGALNYGTAAGGLSCLFGSLSPSDSYFHCGSLLSPNGTRG